MGIQRYSASLDTTITNAYEMNLSTRATGSNAGLADTLETFSIYGQASSASSEISRILIQFPIGDVTSARSAGTIPDSGSVNFFLRMYNAEHSFTLPKDFNLNISAVTRSWEEGYGLDMDEYTDLTYDDFGANWVMAGSGSVPATATVTVVGSTAGTYDNKNIVITDSAGTALTYRFDGNGGFDSETVDAAGPIIGVNGSSTSEIATNIVSSIEQHHSGTILGEASSTTVTLTQFTSGSAGNKNITKSIPDSQITVSGFSGGGNDWVTAGGDYYHDASSSFSASFSNGTEDLEVDITTLVEQWLDVPTGSTTANQLGNKINYGVGIMFPLAQENAKRSYYTKKFFARGSQYYLKRPTIEARWDSSTKDDTGNFFLSSSLASATDNLNTIYLYNNIRGQLTNIPSIGSTGSILVSIYSGSAINTVPSGSKLKLPSGGNVVGPDYVNVTGGYVSAGIYSASFAYVSSSITTIFPVWHSSSTQYHTGSAITVKTFDSVDYNPHPSYVTKITNLRDSYTRVEKTTRFRLHVREKDWNPNIYTKASKTIPTAIIEDGYYKVYRTIDDFEVVGYGTGSTSHTRLSYDTSGSYFDFPVDILASGYMYAFKLLYKMPDGNYREQPEVFKFKVE